MGNSGRRVNPDRLTLSLHARVIRVMLNPPLAFHYILYTLQKFTETGRLALRES